MDLDLDVVSAVAAGLWALGAGAAAAMVVRVVARRAERGVWVPAALAAVMTAAAHAPGLWSGQEPAGPAVLVFLAVGVGAWAACVMALIGVHHRADALRAWLDVAGAVLVVTAIVIAVATGPAATASALTGPAVVLLAVPAAAVVLALTAVIGLLVAGAARTARGQLVIAAALALAAAECAGTLQRAGVIDSAFVVGLHQGGVALSLALWAVAAWVPAPVVVTVEESARAIMIGPPLQLLAAAVVLGIGQRVELPGAAVALALASIGVQVVCIVLVYQVITSLHSSRHQARTDDLTGLGNRRALTSALASTGSGAPLALTVVDLDRFKEVNDVLGHDAGDDLLQQVAARLRAASPTGEVIVRHGGDEFALVAPGSTAKDAAQRATAVLGGLRAPFTLGPRQVSIAASIGIAAAPEHAGDAEELLRTADSAMYRAKEAGGGVVVYDAAIDAERRAEPELLADLRVAIAADQLDVHYQPQIAADGALVGVEALVRWPHPTRGMLLPCAFLALAQRNALMDDITCHVLRTALADKAEIDAGTGTGTGIRMSVNISATCLLDPHLVATVAAALHEHGVPPGELMLEVTETELMLDAEVTHRVVAELVDLGVGVSIDDYGTGHSSLTYLKDLPATELKLDRSFVAELATDPRIATIVRSTVDLAHALGLQLVAEGVEDQTTLHHLIALGVDITQGNYHSHPIPAADLARWHTTRQLTTTTTP